MELSPEMGPSIAALAIGDELAVIAVAPKRIKPFALAENCVYDVPANVKLKPKSVTGVTPESEYPVSRVVVPELISVNVPFVNVLNV
jgi:hypothetical protein